MIFYKSPDKAAGYNYEGTEPSLRGQVWKNGKNNIQQSMEKKQMRQKSNILKPQFVAADPGSRDRGIVHKKGKIYCRNIFYKLSSKPCVCNQVVLF